MAPSKLEKYLSVLETLVSQPSEFESIFSQVRNENIDLKKTLDSLISLNLVERLPLGKKKIVYVVTERGLAVIRALHGEKHKDLVLLFEE